MTPTLVWELEERDRAEWIAGAVDDFGVVLPSAFAARARIPQRRAGRLSEAALAALLPHLAAATATPARCIFAVWMGHAGMLRFGGAPHLTLRHREYQLYRGALDDVQELSSAVYAPGSAHMTAPNIAWPRDGAWVLAAEVELDATYVAGSGVLVDAIVAEPFLGAVRE